MLQRITRALAVRDDSIVVQKRIMTVISTAPGHARERFSLSTQMISEFSATGVDERDFVTESKSKPGFQQIQADNSMQIYDPQDNTIYETTLHAWEAEINHQAQQNLQGEASSTSFGTETAVDVSPGTNGFDQELREHRYRLEGHATIDGRTPLKLVPVRRRYAATHGPSQILGTVYLSQSDYAPIRVVAQISIPGASSGTALSSDYATTWTEYRVMPATARNRRLVSLPARHPTARVVSSAAGYISASTAESAPGKPKPSG